MRFLALLLIVLSSVPIYATATENSEVASSDSELRVQRTWMPDAHPGSFAIGFPAGLNACFDPVRAVVVYAWRGDFVDLEPTLTGKFPRDAKIVGDIFFRAEPPTGFSFPKREGETKVQFKGYQIRKNTSEFRYQIGNTSVRLTLSTSPDGEQLIQNFRIDSWPAGLVYSPATSSSPKILKGNARSSDKGLTFPDGSAVEFREVLTSQAK